MSSFKLILNNVDSSSSGEDDSSESDCIDECLNDLNLLTQEVLELSESESEFTDVCLSSPHRATDVKAERTTMLSRQSNSFDQKDCVVVTPPRSIIGVVPGSTVMEKKPRKVVNPYAGAIKRTKERLKRLEASKEAKKVRYGSKFTNSQAKNNLDRQNMQGRNSNAMSFGNCVVSDSCAMSHHSTMNVGNSSTVNFCTHTSLHVGHQVGENSLNTLSSNYERGKLFCLYGLLLFFIYINYRFTVL